MSVERREWPAWYPSSAHGIEAPDHPQMFSLVLHRGFYAFSLVCDFKDEERKFYLDFGSGGGFLTELIAPAFKVAFGVERRPEARAYAEAFHGRGGVKYLPSLEEARKYAPYDFITFLDVIEHVEIEEAKGILKDLASMMTPHAVLYITTPIAVQKDGKNPNNKYHVHEYQPGELREMLEGYFGAVEISCLSVRTFNAVCREPKR